MRQYMRQSCASGHSARKKTGKVVDAIPPPWVRDNLEAGANRRYAPSRQRRSKSESEILKPRSLSGRASVKVLAWSAA
jgi:hypothetical protein